jgi:hypothetical protein
VGPYPPSGSVPDRTDCRSNRSPWDSMPVSYAQADGQTTVGRSSRLRPLRAEGRVEQADY